MSIMNFKFVKNKNNVKHLPFRILNVTGCPAVIRSIYKDFIHVKTKKKKTQNCTNKTTLSKF
jgi:hypothetical protein